MQLNASGFAAWLALLMLAVSAIDAAAADLSGIVRLMERQDYASAERALRQVLAQDSDAEADYLLGFLLIQTYRYDEAEQHLQRAVEARPGEAHWMMALAKAQLEQGRNLAAGKVLQRAIRLDPQPAYYHAHAMTALNTGDLAAAEASLRACVKIEPEHADALFRLGGLLVDQGNNTEGIEYLERARIANPGNVDALFKLATAYRYAGRPEEAEPILRNILQRIPGHVGALHTLSRVLLQTGRTDEAKAVMARFREMSALRDEIDFNAHAVRKNPQNIDGRLHLASLYMRAGRIQDALTDLHAARVLAPRDARIYRSLARAYRSIGDNDNAVRAERYANSIEGASRP